jgi:hypothetical protein
MEDQAVERRSETLDRVCEFLDGQDWKYSISEDDSSIHTGFRDESGSFFLKIVAPECPPVLGVIVNLPLAVPENRRVAMAEAVARANYGLLLGCFDLDMSDGELGFRAVMPLEEAAPTEGQFGVLLLVSCATAVRYYRAFSRLVFCDDLSPAEVIAEVEMAVQSELKES